MDALAHAILDEFAVVSPVTGEQGCHARLLFLRERGLVSVYKHYSSPSFLASSRVAKMATCSVSSGA